MHTLRVVVLLGTCFIAGAIVADLTTMDGYDRHPTPTWGAPASEDVDSRLESVQTDAAHQDRSAAGTTNPRAS